MRKLLLLIVLVPVLLNSRAQSRHAKFDHLGIKDGLPERVIQFIFQDSQGYIWMGTQNGLLRYDGYKPKVYVFGIDKDAPAPNCSVETIAEDNNKNIWVSTFALGLFMYDRSKDRFIQYKYPEQQGKKVAHVKYLKLVDNKNNLWGFSWNFEEQTHVDVFRTIPGSNHYETYANRKNSAGDVNFTDANSLCKTTNGHIWLGTSNGIYEYDNGVNTFHGYLTTNDTAKQVAIGNIYEAPSEPGILWMNTYYKTTKKYVIARFDTRSHKLKEYFPSKYSSLNDLNENVNNIFEDRQKRLWFTTNGGLLLADRKNDSFISYLPVDAIKSAGKNQFGGILEAKDHSLWITSGMGLLTFDPDKRAFYRYVNNPDDHTSLSGNSMEFNYYDVNNNMLIDRSGSLWLTIQGHGADKVNLLTSAFITHVNNPAKRNSCPAGGNDQLTATKDNYVVLTSKTGIYKWLPGTGNFRQIFKTPIGERTFGGLAIDKDGNIYFGKAAGLEVYNPKQKKTERYSNKPHDSTSISGNELNSIVVDHTGTVWVGTGKNGICTFNPATHKFFQFPYITNNGSMDSHGKLDDNSVITVYEDLEGTVWSGTNFGGLDRFNRKTGKFTSYMFDGNTRVTCVEAIFEDREGRLWVGSYLTGLYLFDRKTARYTRHFDEANGLLINSVSGIQEDNSGFIWIDSDRGLTRLDPKDMSLKQYSFNSIIPDATGAAHENSLTFANNRIVFGLLNGIVDFDPADLANNPAPPIVHIEKVSYSDPRSTKDTSASLQRYGLKDLTLPWNQNRIVFNYIALHFASPAQNKYAYYLQGYDKHWVQAGASRSVAYNNLSPGTYTFYVKAANSDGVWNNKGDSFIFTINSPWWSTWWAWLLYVILFSSAVYTFIAYRSRKLRHDKKILEHKVHVRTEEVMQQKEEIESQRDNLEKTLTHLKATQTQLIQSEKMASLGELTAGIAHEIQNPLNFVNNFSEVNTELIDEMEQEIEKGDLVEIKSIAADIRENEKKINLHGKRADSIVKGMLQHSQLGSGAKEPTNINALGDEYMRLAYHGLRAKDKSFNAELVTHFDPGLPKIKVVQQDIGRVLLNLFNNAFYAVNQKQKTGDENYKAEVMVTTSIENGQVIIKVKDNGNGIPDAIKDKIMQPFFTTKPTGEGTGLGLSLTYDMVVKGHGGSIQVNSVEGEGSEFIVSLPTG